MTGGAGWLGQSLLHSLVDGLADCRDLPRPSPGARIRVLALPGDEPTIRQISPDIEVVVGDLSNPTDCDRFCADASGSILFHLAGIIHPRRFIREFYDVNYQGSKNLLASAVRSGVRRAVVVSANAPLGCGQRSDHVFDEASPYNPYMNYGRSKMLMERHVLAVRRQSDLETVVIRACWFYGPFQPDRQTLFFRMIRDGRIPVVGSGDNRRSMTYIDNLSQGLLLAAAAVESDGRVYWIADERPYSWNEIVDTVERLLENEFGQKCRHTRMRLPDAAGRLAEACDKAIQGIGLYHQKIHVLSEVNKTIACSIDKAKRELGYVPAVGLEEGMRRSLRWAFDRGVAAW